MEWLGKLLGSKKAVDNILDKDSGLLAKAGSWVGNMNYTDEEKAEANQATREWGIRQLEALTPFKVVQRILAFTVALMWVFGGVNYIGAVWVEAFYDVEVSEKIGRFIFSDYVLWPTMAVFALYFSGGVINSFNTKKQGG